MKIEKWVDNRLHPEHHFNTQILYDLLKLRDQEWVEEIGEYYSVPCNANADSIVIKISHNDWQSIKSRMEEGR